MSLSTKYLTSNVLFFYPLVMLAFCFGLGGDCFAVAQTNSKNDVESDSIEYDSQLAGHFSGRVIGSDNKPFPHALVYAVPESGPHSVFGPVRAHTDADGRFEFDAPDMTYTDFDGLPSRRVGLLIATAEGFAPDAQGFRKGTAEQEFEFFLATDDVPIRGRLIDAEGHSVENARVRLMRIEIPSTSSLDEFLAREANSVNRNTLFSQNNANRSLGPLHLFPGVTTETQTEMDGSFTIRGIGRDRLAHLIVSAPDVVDTKITVMTRNDPDVGTLFDSDGMPTFFIRGSNFELPLKKGVTIEGCVIDSDTQVPIMGMLVGSGNQDPPRDGNWTDPAVTDAEGRFQLTGLDPRPKQDYQITAASPPGLAYWTAAIKTEDGQPITIKCQRGIPYRLKIVDEQGRPVQADVKYCDILKRPRAPFQRQLYPNRPVCRVTRQTDGTYEGFVMPGPGAVVISTPGQSYCRARVDADSFFADESLKSLAKINLEYFRQHDYAAVVLVNPDAGSEPLELTANVTLGNTRMVSLVDSTGQPVVGAKVRGIRPETHEWTPPLRAATFPLTGLHPDHARPFTFTNEDRQLVGFLAVQGNDSSLTTVVMQPWGTLTGRVIDPSEAALSRITILFRSELDPQQYRSTRTDTDGKFKVTHLLPGHKYVAQFSRNSDELIEVPLVKIALEPGEASDLGDITLAEPPAENKTKKFLRRK